MKYTSREQLNELQSRLKTFIPSLLSDDVKPKREDQIRNACLKKNADGQDLFDLQLQANAYINDIIVSQILGGNEIIIPFFVDEYKSLKKSLELVNNEYKKLNQFQELKEIITPFNLKQINSWLFDDLTQVVTDYNISGVDVKELVKGI